MIYAQDLVSVSAPLKHFLYALSVGILSTIYEGLLWL